MSAAKSQPIAYELKMTGSACDWITSALTKQQLAGRCFMPREHVAGADHTRKVNIAGR
jgi:hypothetical protein